MILSTILVILALFCALGPTFRINWRGYAPDWHGLALAFFFASLLVPRVL